MNRIPRQFFTADTLFGSESAADMRGFAGPDEMNEAMIERWNSAVGEDDLVWVLGNFNVWASHVGPEDQPVAGILRELNGVKNLVAGPLDWVFAPHAHRNKHLAERVAYYRGIGFKAVVTGRAIASKTGKPVLLPLRARADNLPEPVIVSHFPYDVAEPRRDRFALWRPQRPRGGPAPWLLHGDQAEWVVQDRQVNVGADAWDLEPVGADVVLGLIGSEQS